MYSVPSKDKVDETHLKVEITCKQLCHTYAKYLSSSKSSWWWVKSVIVPQPLSLKPILVQKTSVVESNIKSYLYVCKCIYVRICE